MANRLTIRDKLTLALAGMTLVAVLVAGAALTLFTNLTLERRVRQVAEPYARLVSVGAEGAVRFEDAARAQEILETLRTAPQILEAAIFLDDGRLLGSYRRDASGPVAQASLRPDGIYLTRGAAELTQSLRGGAHLFLLVSLAELNRQSRELVFALVSGLLVLLVGATLGLRIALQRAIVGPVVTLAKSVEQVRDRADYRQRVPTSGADEVARLGQSFNAMMAAVGERDSELRQLTLFQRALLDSAGSGIVSVASDGTISSLNPAAERMLGYQAEEVVGKLSALELHDSDEIARHARRLSEELDEPVPADFEVFAARPRRDLPEEGEWTMVRKDGTRFPALLSVTALRGENDGITGFLGLVHDLTERKRAEVSLQKKTEELDNYFANALDLLCITDAKGRFLRLNPAWRSTLGYSVGELRGRRLLDFVHPDDLEATTKAVARMAEESKVLEFTNRYLAKRGDYRWLEWRAIPSGDRIYAVVRDISERKRAEEALHRLNRELRAISNCNEVLMRATDEQALLNDVCRIVCEEAGYRMAWVGYAETDEAKTVRPVGWAGREEGYLAAARITWGGENADRGPAGNAIRSGTSVCLQDFAIDHVPSPWRALGLELGYRSSIALPLKDEKGAVFGAFTIYSTEPNAFTEGEVRLLEELAGDLAFGINVLRDRQERKRAEEQLRRSEERYRALIQKLQVAVVVHTADTRIVTCNVVARTLLGLTEDQMLGKTAIDPAWHFFREDGTVMPVEEYPVNRVLAARRPLRNQILGVHRPGLDEDLWAMVNANPVFGAADEITEVIVTFVDITERRRAQEKLAHLASIVESSDDAIVGKTLDETIVSWNRGAERVYGYTADEIVGRSISVLVPPGLDGELEAIMEALRRGERVEHHETTRMRKDGQIIHVALTISPIRDGPGKVVGASAIARDITERVRAEAEIRELNADLELRVAERTEQLVKANRELEAFAYSVSHDLRAPLRHVDGFIEMLAERSAGLLDEKCQRYMKDISEAAQRMGKLIDDLLSFSRMGRREMLAVTVDMNSLVREVIRTMEPDVEGRQVRWELADLPSVSGDRSMLRVVLQNLLANSVKFTRPRELAVIEIVGEKQGNEVVFQVKDNGVGFEPEYGHKLFGVFQRLHRDDEFEGTGIGLAHVRRIVERHGGRVWAEGAVDQGAAFYFTIRLDRESTP